MNQNEIEKTMKIYESPDKGKTIYEREFGSDPSSRKIVKTATQKQWDIVFKDDGAKP